MALEHFDWESNDVIVIHLMGPITFGQGTSKLRSVIREALDSGKTNILLDMAEVQYLDSSGLGELVAAQTTVASRGGQLKLLKLTRRVQDIAQLTRIYRIFDIFDDEDKAIRSFKQ